jgi:hypothetical protein
MESSVTQQAYTSMMKFTIDGRPFLNVNFTIFNSVLFLK